MVSLSTALILLLGLTPGASGAPRPSESVYHVNPPFSLALEENGPGPEFCLAEGPAALPLGAYAGASASVPSGDTSLPPRPRTLRAWLELAGLQTVSIGSYWIRYKSHFQEDWQFRMTFKEQFQRIVLLKGWRFDSNMFGTNSIHLTSGLAYYQTGRTNHASWLFSWLMSAVGSTTWEISEWKEVISLNDQIMSGIGGFAMGEPWYQAGNYLAHQPGLFYQVLSFMNPFLKINNWLDRKDPRIRNYVLPGWHDTAVAAGVRSLSTAGRPAETAAYFEAHARFILPPDYGQAGDVRRTFKDTYLSSMSVDYADRHGAVDEMRFSSDAVPWGYFRQKIDENREGYSLIVGLGSAIEYVKKRPIDQYDINPVPVNMGIDLHLEIPRNFTDKLAIIHMAGPVVDWTVFRRGWKLRSTASAYFDFGLINAYALNRYSELHHTLPSDTIDGMKTTVLYYGYYYGFGGTLSGSTNLEWGAFRARALLSFSSWGSADTLDRFPDRVTNNAHLSDTRFRYLFGAGWKVPRMPVELFATFEGVQRNGRVLEARAGNLEKRLFAGLEFSF